MTDRSSDSRSRADDQDRQHVDAERKAELDYIKAERAGVKIDKGPPGHSLKVEE